MTPPAPVENPSYRSAAKAVAEMPDASPDRFTATLLFPSQPDKSRAASPLSEAEAAFAPNQSGNPGLSQTDLWAQPAPDPSTRIAAPPSDAPVLSPGEPVAAHGLEAELTAPQLFAPDLQSPGFTSIPQPEQQQVGVTDAPSVKAFFSGEPVVNEASVAGSVVGETDGAQAPFSDAPSVVVPLTNGQQASVLEVPPTMATSAPPAAYVSVPEQLPVTQSFAAQAVEAVESAADDNLAIAAPAASDPLAAEPATTEFVSEEAVEVEEEPVEQGISVITREATVLGDIITEGHIDIVGRVKGNIDAKGDVAIHGIVRGDVGGSKIGLYSCRVKGNLDAGLGVIVDENSIIGGDVKTKNIIFDGKVKGNIDAGNVVVLRSHSYCLGDVQAASLAVEPGAVLNGKVRTFVEGDLEAPFDEVL
jgi:cytoskeletal protein CcmA (bactofilin family)